MYWLFKKERNSFLKRTGNLLLFIVLLFCNLACRCVEMYCWFIDPHMSDILRVTAIGCATMCLVSVLPCFAGITYPLCFVSWHSHKLKLCSNDKLTFRSWFSGTVPETRLVFRSNFVPNFALFLFSPFYSGTLLEAFLDHASDFP